MALICIAAMLLFSGVCYEQPYDNLPLLVTAYNPMQGGINCNEDCSTFGTGVLVSDSHFSNAAACPAEWVRLDRTAVVTIYGHEYQCLDNFGDVKNRYPVYQNGEWYLRIDLVLKKPELWGIQIIDEWSMKWN